MHIEQKHKCQDCKKEFEWFHQVPQDMGSSSFVVEAIPANKVPVKQVLKFEEKDGHKMPKEVTVYCPHCEYLNKIEIE
ncbi:hypothetical protein JQ038_10330 [Clostridium botulinum]|nr:hypothetical protein [Clostridium botulinum]MCS4472337.1 hypothetical protein [Clostridium botulinum]MCS4474837.1 hypothetical protein [Clostridium botulinum]MCS4482732.1 hypothetical protein [Clostridium botulinum]